MNQKRKRSRNEKKNKITTTTKEQLFTLEHHTKNTKI